MPKTVLISSILPANFGFRADPSDATGVSNVNESIPVQTFKQVKPNPIGALNATVANLATPGTDGISIITDAGPNPTDGSAPERQAGAVAGDGIYYVEARYTPPKVTDYYFDILLTDVAGNSFNFDNIWGFSNQAFNKALPTNDLLVSDYMQGQRFPGLTGQARFTSADPVENYYLSIPGGEQYGTIPTTFAPGTVDVWRTLCRGPVPFNVMLLYAPTQTLQIDPANPTNPALTRSLAVASSSIIWGAPYARFGHGRAGYYCRYANSTRSDQLPKSRWSPVPFGALDCVFVDG